MMITRMCGLAVVVAFAAVTTACSSSGPSFAPTSRSSSAVSTSGSASDSLPPSTPSAAPSDPGNRPTLDAATAKMSFRQALGELPADTQYVQYIDWDALGHPQYGFHSVVEDGMDSGVTDRWAELLTIRAHSEQWSASFVTARSEGLMLHWRDPAIVASVVSLLKARHWRSSGPASATRLTYPNGDKAAAAMLFLGTEVVADAKTGTLVAFAHGQVTFPTTPRSSVLAVNRYRPLLNTLPQFAAASLYLGPSAACNRFPDRQPAPPATFVKQYVATVARFHVVASTAAVLTAASIPAQMRFTETRQIASDVFVQLADDDAARADLDGRATIGASRMLQFGNEPTYFKVGRKEAIGPVDHYAVVGPGPVEFRRSSSIGYNVCGTAG